MYRGILMATAVACWLGAVAAPAQTPAWWNAAYPNMKNQSQSSTWYASDGDSVDNVVRTMYGVPPDRVNTIASLGAAVIAYNQALSRVKAQDPSKFGDKVTSLDNRDPLKPGTVYYVPDPDSLDRILKGESPDTVVGDSLRVKDDKGVDVNMQQARGEAGFSPIHALGPLATNVPDGPAGAVPRTATTPGGTPGTATAPVGPMQPGGMSVQPVRLLDNVMGMSSSLPAPSSGPNGQSALLGDVPYLGLQLFDSSLPGSGLGTAGTAAGATTGVATASNP